MAARKNLQDFYAASFKINLPKPKPIKLSTRDTAVIIVDVQNDYHTKKGALYVGKLADQATPHIVVLANKANAAGIPIIFTQNVYEPKDSARNLPRWWSGVRHAIRGTWGWEIIDELKPVASGPNATVFEKKWYGAFDDPSCGISAKVKELKVKNIVICGTSTNWCVMHTAAGAARLGYRIILPIDCCATDSDAEQAIGIFQMSNLYKAFVTTSYLMTFTRRV